ncbi:tRNA-dihydrouridine(47) synthase [NAD(P)(+)]-like protein [Physocladia obscura]|uniref:tRNA-dihydrouridine(47) synthase [NAD(P)(+)] n=1 Tax=Physocladia obscura TaxID=109957 RepID=A0AAD5SY84_9FUNG|nr:tRNA-dihydrouridine(47) synthase [NAD(P)(+)]-like protein [Physocladia obscura]
MSEPRTLTKVVPIKAEYCAPVGETLDYRNAPRHKASVEYIAATAHDAAHPPSNHALGIVTNHDQELEQEPEAQASKRQKTNQGSKATQNQQRIHNKSGGREEHSFNLCFTFAELGECPYGDKCKLSHDVAAYLETCKPADLSSDCPIFATFGKCRFGARCRFSSAHHDPHTDLFNLADSAKVASSAPLVSLNQVYKKDLIAAAKEFKKTTGGSARVKEFVEWSNGAKDFAAFKARVANLAANARKEANAAALAAVGEKSDDFDHAAIAGSVDNTVKSTNDNSKEQEKQDATTTATTDFDESFANSLQYLPESELQKYHTRQKENHDREVEFLAKGRDVDKKPFEWSGTYLAPLTNVGNLPFRRIAKDYGVDITCAEMAMCYSLTSFTLQEWALVRRHPSEKKFGIQVAAARGLEAAKAGDAIHKLLFENPSNMAHPSGLAPFDFVDLNCGCPIDLVYNAGAGSALIANRSRIRDIIYALRHTLPVPVSVKIRTGINNTTNIAHKLIPNVAEWGAAAMTLHGRSRQQRYTKHANWDYINECAKIAHASGIKFYGNGDVLGFEDYYSHMPDTDSAAASSENDAAKVDGIMVGRGALIKPWIFEEIRERRVWDISGRERFEMFQKFAAYGIEHWGSDTKGINTTRQYLLDWMSFTHRYVPVGLLEVLPQKLNERPPVFYGRDYMETLLASPKVSDWIYVTEKILGKTPDDFRFTPKHKSNSYEGGDEGENNVHG